MKKKPTKWTEMNFFNSKVELNQLTQHAKLLKAFKLLITIITT